MRKKWWAVLVAFAFALSPVGIAGCYHGGEGGDDSPPAQDGGTGEGEEGGGGGGY